MSDERTDPLAATYAEMALHALLSAWLRSVARGELHEPERVMAKAIVDRYIARIEHHNGQRRVVLYGAWETDPAVTARFVPKADAA